METLFQDLKYSLRSIKNNSGFAIAAVIALAIAIGANTVVFSVLNAVLLNPLAFSHAQHPDRLAVLYERNPLLQLFFANRMPPRPATYKVWKEQAHSFEQLGTWQEAGFTLSDPDSSGRLKPEQVPGGRTTPAFFSLLGIRPVLGRGFTPADMVPGKDQVAILGNELYRKRFNADPHVLGRTVLLDGKPFRIVGVLPPGVQVPALWGGFIQEHIGIWTPLNLNAGKHADEQFGLYVYGRLRPSVTIQQASAELNAISKRLANQNAEDYAGFGVNVISAIEEDVGADFRRALLVLQGAVVFVLLIACANVGNLLLTRAVARSKEVAVRIALGSSRWRLVRQIMTESLLLSLAGAILGILFSFWGIRVISALGPKDVHGIHELRIDSPVLLFTAGICVLAAILFGLAPSWRASHENVSEQLNRSARGVVGSSNRLRKGLAVAEVALSLVLVIGAGLMIRSLALLMNTNLGFRVDHLAVMRVTLPVSRYPKAEQLAAFDDRLIGRVRQLPGIVSAALTTALPMRSVQESSFGLPGKTFKPGQKPTSDWAMTSDGYFKTIGLPLFKGRAFTRDEALSDIPQVAVVNRAFVRLYWPDEDPIGKEIRFGDPERSMKVIGVVGNEHQMGPDQPEHPEFYIPGHEMRDLYVVVRTAADPASVLLTLKQPVWSIDKDQAVDVATEEDALRDWAAPRRFNMTVLAAFGVAALLLAAVGLFSVLAYSVTLRTREIGVRVALGAEPRKVASRIVREGFLMTATGIVLGACCALALTRFMQTVVFGVSTFDPVTFIGAALLLAAVSLLASYIPAMRAARIDPVDALRQE